jgi:hypothetical protein
MADSRVTLRKIVTDQKVSSKPILSHLTKTSGLAETGLAQLANRKKWHLYKKTDALPTATISAHGGALPDSSTTNDNIGQIDLKRISMLQSESVEIVDDYTGGKAKYFEDNYPVYLEAFSQKLAKQMIYGINSTFGDATGFKGIWDYARDNHDEHSTNLIEKGGTTGSRTSIWAVNWNPLTCSILVDPMMQNRGGEFLDVRPISNGEPVIETDGSGNRYYVYQILYLASLGFFAASRYNVAGITQIDSSNKPTASNMNQLLDYVRAMTSSTVIYCNRRGWRYINDLKDGNLEMTTADKNYDNQVASWANIPIVLEENISDSETTALD